MSSKDSDLDKDCKPSESESALLWDVVVLFEDTQRNLVLLDVSSSGKQTNYKHTRTINSKTCSILYMKSGCVFHCTYNIE